MKEEQRLLLAVVLSAILIFTYQRYLSKHYKAPAIKTSVESKQQLSRQQATGTQTAAGGVVEESLQKSSRSFADEKTVVVENELYRALLTNIGAGVKELYLKKFKDKEGNPYLFARPEESLPLILEIDEVAGGKEAVWEIKESRNGTIVYQTEDAKRSVVKIFKFHKTNYIIELTLKIRNKLDIAQDIRYKIVGGSGIVTHGQVDSGYVSADAQIGEKVYRRKPSHKGIQRGENLFGNPEWVATKGRYFSFILKPEQPEGGAFIEGIDRRHIFSGVILGPLALHPKEETEHRFILYAGPNNRDKIDMLGPTASNAVNYGPVINGIGVLMLSVLRFFYNIFHNYGIAIIMMAFFISVILFPLTRKSLASMKEMQKIQPEVEKIKNEYKDNPQKMNKEVMGLYKKHKINPLGGCLPMFLQFPIFIALYQVLIRSVELKGASFLWVKDLSEPDSAFKLPLALPMLGDCVNILPILMVLAMVFQQKLSHPKGSEVPEQQRMMSMVFLVVLGVIFYNLPSGLVLYWLTNTIIMIIVQEFLLKSAKPA